MNEATVLAGLERWASSTVGEEARVSDLRTLNGHAGLTFGFNLTGQDGVEPLVLRLAPPGVRRTANNDVLRQVPLLDTLGAAGLPVAAVYSSGSEPDFFGTDYLIVEHRPGEQRPTDGWSAGNPPDDAQYIDAAGVLGLIQARTEVDALRGILTERSVTDEIKAWERAMEKTLPEHTERVHTLRDQLLVAAPDPTPISLIHGDYQFSNLLFVGDRISAVLDWELAGIGARLLDLGWLLAITDDRNWSHPLPIRANSVAERMVEAYGKAVGRAVAPDDVAYFEALACWRFAVIAGLNLHLHRSGRRVDDHWERIAPSVPGLLRRAAYLLG